MGRVISVTHVGQGDVPAECRGQDTEQGVSCVTRLVSSGCLHEQGHSCRPTAQPPAGRLPWLWAWPWDPSLQTGLRASAGAPLLPPAETPPHSPPTGMRDFEWRLCHPRNIACFPWCVLWERGKNGYPHCRPHTWAAAGKLGCPGPALSSVPRGWAPERPPPPRTCLETRWEHPWGWDLGRGGGRGFGRERRSTAPHPGPGPCWPSTVFESGRQKRGCQLPYCHNRVTSGKPHPSLSLSLTLRTVGSLKALSTLRGLKLGPGSWPGQLTPRG